MQDGTKVFTGSCDKTAKMWDLNSNQTVQIAQVSVIKPTGQLLNFDAPSDRGLPWFRIYYSQHKWKKLEQNEIILAAVLATSVFHLTLCSLGVTFAVC